MYSIENYKDNIRFNKQYDEIRKFLQIIADNGYNEHFHWGRFDWMMSHSYLDVEMLSRNALFRNENGELVGAVMYDTSFNDRWYILHSISDESLLGQNQAVRWQKLRNISKSQNTSKLLRLRMENMPLTVECGTMAEIQHI